MSETKQYKLELPQLPVATSHPCAGCHSGCCRAYAVPVSGADILRIEQRLGLAFWDFVSRWADPDGALARYDAPHFWFRDDPNTPFVICLSHEQSRRLPGTTKCRFLIEGEQSTSHPLGQGSCGIYDHRPAACRVFPTRLDAAGDRAVIHDVPEYGRRDKHPAYSLCPKPWTPLDVDPIEGVQSLIIARHEMAFFKRLAPIWNNSSRDWQTFPDFLHQAYAHRVVYEDDLAESSELVDDATIDFPRPKLESQPRKTA